MELRYFLPLIIVIEGFVSIAIEILTIRQLLPVAGSSVVVTSLVIGIFLLFLALGYRQGGKHQAELTKQLRKNFLIAAIWLGLGLSYGFVIMFFYGIQQITGPHIIYPLVSYLLLVIAPLIYMLGQTVPITMNMMKQNNRAGVIAGYTLGLSTVGSFLGATITTLLLMHFFGVAWTVFVNFALLMLLFLVLSESRNAFVAQLLVVVSAGIIVFGLNIKAGKQMFIADDNYANYQILSAKNEKVLTINGTFSSYINSENKGFRYIEKIKKILFEDMKLHDANILILGAGGFTLSAEKTLNNHFTYVDIDQKLKKIIVPRFVSKINGELIVDDARHFLQMTPKQYHVIIVDAYTNTKAIPAHLLTYEYMRLIQKRLTENGTAILNVVANPLLMDSYSKRIDNTIRAVFRNCMVSPAVYANAASNIIYVCANEKSQADKTIYSDNLNTSATDYFEW